MHINKNFRSKFDDKAVHGHLVGYVNDRDGFRVWIPTQRKIVLSHDVRFKPEVVCNVRVNTYKLENSCEKHASSEVQKPEEVNDDEKEEWSEAEEFVPVSSSGGSDVPAEDVKEETTRKNKRESKKPWWMTSGDFVYMAGSSITENKNPNSYIEVLQSPDREEWLKALKEELDSLEKNDTWVFVERPKDVKILKNRWVF